ncbi:unnamed protein product [Phytophthora fragariaefolia]|uniref:Unnamed protein product n=1 Tax=Phytophthora fragariaefolia TaxID=1490495 RepID=A0A9W6XJB8_9STRA|nr:unnamed protein product [Phytophthora fragariaefolia]
MEWNNSRYQLPTNQSAFAQPSLRSTRSRYWCYNDDDEDEDEETHEAQEHESMLRRNRFDDDSVLAPPLSIPSLKMEAPFVHGSNNGGIMLQSLSSLGMPLEEPTEFQPFFSAQNSGFSDSAFLQPSQQQQPGEQLPSQFSSPPFGQFPPMASYYTLSTSLPPAQQTASRSSVDYFSEGNAHPVPSLPPFGQHTQQHQLPASEYEEKGPSSEGGMLCDASPMVFSAAMSATRRETINSAQTSLTLPPGSFPYQLSSSDAQPKYNPVQPIKAGKRQGAQLSTNFSKMVTEEEPKFSTDKRKLCCVEGCKSQARAFNRCKRHGGSKRCSSPGCTKSVQSRGLCIRHGGGSRCQELGCSRASQSHGRCKMHGGGRPCIVAGCEKKAHLKRLCRKHGGGAKCCVEDCEKWAQRHGMCMTHAKVATAQTSGMGFIGDAFLDSRKSPPAPSASSSPSLQFFTDNLPG